MKPGFKWSLEPGRANSETSLTFLLCTDQIKFRREGNENDN